MRRALVAVTLLVAAGVGGAYAAGGFGGSPHSSVASAPARFAVGHFVRGLRRLDASRTRRLLRALTGAGPRRGCAKQRRFAVVIRSPGSVASIELGGCWRVDRPDRLAGIAKPAVVRAILGVR